MNTDDAIIKVLDLADLACPTWGLSDPFMTSCSGSEFLTHTVGPPYNPIIAPPNELLSIDPAWTDCDGIARAGQFVNRYGAYDPPRALNEADELDPPAITSASSLSGGLPITAAPGSTASLTLATASVLKPASVVASSSPANSFETSPEPPSQSRTAHSSAQDSATVRWSGSGQAIDATLETASLPLAGQVPPLAAEEAVFSTVDQLSVPAQGKSSAPATDPATAPSRALITPSVISLARTSGQVPGFSSPLPIERVSPIAFPAAAAPAPRLGLPLRADAESEQTTERTIGLGAILPNGFGAHKLTSAHPVASTIALSIPRVHPPMTSVDEQTMSGDLPIALINDSLQSKATQEIANGGSALSQASSSALSMLGVLPGPSLEDKQTMSATPSISLIPGTQQSEANQETSGNGTTLSSNASNLKPESDKSSLGPSSHSVLSAAAEPLATFSLSAIAVSDTTLTAAGGNGMTVSRSLVSNNHLQSRVSSEQPTGAEATSSLPTTSTSSWSYFSPAHSTVSAGMSSQKYDSGFTVIAKAVIAVAAVIGSGIIR